MSLQYSKSVQLYKFSLHSSISVRNKYLCLQLSMVKDYHSKNTTNFPSTNKLYLLSQEVPFPLNPGLQEQEKLPMVFWQIAFESQVKAPIPPPAHSSTSGATKSFIEGPIVSIYDHIDINTDSCCELTFAVHSIANIAFIARTVECVLWEITARSIGMAIVTAKCALIQHCKADINKFCTLLVRYVL